MSRKLLVGAVGLWSVVGSGGCVTGAPDCDQERCEEAPADAGAENQDDGESDEVPASDGPTIAVLATSVRDERQDLVEFTDNGGPRSFDHRGQLIEVGGDGCPVVYKHAFLLRPDHGAEESPANPIELRFRVAADPDVGVDPDGGAYRVRAQGAGEYLTDWLPVAGSADGPDALVFTAGIDRGAVPELLAAGGPLAIELRGRDRSGREVIAERCLDLVALAGPLAVGQPEAMPRFSLLYDDPIAPILNGTAAWPLVGIEVSNGTPDPVFARFDRSAVSGTCSKRWQRWNLLGSISTGAVSCESDPTRCQPPDLEPVIDHDDPVACSPTLSSSSSLFDLRVAVNGVAVEACAGCAANEYRLPPRSVAVVSLVAVDVPGLQPRTSAEPEETYGDLEVLYRTGASGAGGCPGSSDCDSMRITGSVTNRSGCSKSMLIGDELFCTERRTYKMVRALTTASAEFADLSIDLASVSVGASARQTPPTGYGEPRVLAGYLWSTSEGSRVPDA